MEFEVNGITYRASKLDAMKQFHIVRRLAPILAEISSAFKGETMEALSSMADALARLDDKDANMILFGLLNAVERKELHGVGYSKITTANETLMYQDIDLPAMLQIAYKSGVYNFQDFFQKLPSISVAGK